MHRPDPPAPARRASWPWPVRVALAGAVALAVVALVGILPPSRAPLIGPGPTPPAGRPAGFEDGWLRLAPAPVALTEVAAAAFAGRIWVAGGLDADGRATDRVLVYDPARDEWSEGPSLPEPVHHAALVSDGSVLYLLGGYVGAGFARPTDAVRMLRRPVDTEWLDHSTLPEPRAAGAAGAMSGGLVYAGGVGPGGPSSVVLATDGSAWRRIGALSEAREHLGGASDDAERMMALGGRIGGLGGNVATVDVVEGVEGVEGGDPGADPRVRRVGELPTARGGVAAFWWPSLGGCLVGGEGPTGTHDEAECIELDGTVVRLPSLGVPRHGLGAAVVDGRAYALLGGPEPGLTVSDVAEVLVLPAE